MRLLLSEIDALLRGRFKPEADVSGRTPRALLLYYACLLLGAAYGVFMGLYALLRGGTGVLQLLQTILKVPLLFLLTLLVTFPSLYVFSALARSRLGFGSTLRLLLAAITVNLALLASLGPVTGFFTLSTTSYPFMVLLNVAFFAFSGMAGLAFLQRSLGTVFEAPGDTAREEPPPAGAALAAPRQPATPGLAPLPREPEVDPGRRIFRVWVLMYAIVGAQMGWVLRPFIGAPNAPFQLFRSRDSNIFVACVEAFGNLFR